METLCLDPTRQSLTLRGSGFHRCPVRDRCYTGSAQCYSNVTAAPTATSGRSIAGVEVGLGLNDAERSQNVSDVQGVDGLTRNSGSLRDGSSAGMKLSWEAGACLRKRAACLRKRRRIRRTDSDKRSQNVSESRGLKNLSREFGQWRRRVPSRGWRISFGLAESGTTHPRNPVRSDWGSRIEPIDGFEL